jgi:hypothetical protein
MRTPASARTHGRAEITPICVSESPPIRATSAGNQKDTAYTPIWIAK